MDDHQAEADEAAAAATYAYCIIRGTAAEPLADVPPGVPGAQPPRLLSIVRGLVLVAADAPLADYAAAVIESRLADLSWVSDCALAHEAVVEHFVAGGDILPMKLFTLFSDDARAVAELAAEAPRLSRLLDRVAGAEEWGVRVRYSPERARQAVAAEAAPAATGRAFLERKRRQQEAARGGAERAREAAAAAHRDLAGGSRAAVVRSLPDSSSLVLDAAYLVPREVSERFRGAVADAAERLATCEVTLTGPWPPYHFAGEES